MAAGRDRGDVIGPQHRHQARARDDPPVTDSGTVSVHMARTFGSGMKGEDCGVPSSGNKERRKLERVFAIASHARPS